MKRFIDETKIFLEEMERKLRSITEETSRVKPQPNKWSCKEILGHLVDSSVNNMPRFINGQSQEDLVFTGYDQNKWVEIQNYQELDWKFIIDVWRLNNQLIIRVGESMPNYVMSQQHKNHNFDIIAWREVPPNESSSLEYLIRDYYGHMKHHLNQIFERCSEEQ